jgi:hypothetical protein
MQRARAYICAEEPVNIPLSSADGNPASQYFTSYGCPVFSGGDNYYTELLFIQSHKEILEWFEEVAQVGRSYRNPAILEVTVEADDTSNSDTEGAGDGRKGKDGKEKGDWSNDNWEAMPEEKKPIILFTDQDALEEELNTMRKIKHLMETGKQPMEEGQDDGGDDN